jgi:diguanylate cyclase (GGDEF)-like protein
VTISTTMRAAPVDRQRIVEGRPWRALGVVAVAAVLVALLVSPVDGLRHQVIARSTSAIGSVVFLVAVVQMTGPLRWMWRFLWGYHAVTVAADIIYDIQTARLGEPPFPGVADVFYLASYAGSIAALIVLGRMVSPHHDVEAWIDTAIITAAGASVVGAFVIAPTLDGAAAMDLTTIVSLAYPVLDLFVLAALVRILVLRRAWNRSATLLAGSLVMVLAYDLVYQYQAITGQWQDRPWLEVIWAGSLWAMVFAATAPHADRLDDLPHVRDDEVTLPRLFMLGLGVLTPAVVTIGLAWREDAKIAKWVSLVVAWVVTLLLWRAYRLLRTVQARGDELAHQARIDPLTGLANRRTWDHEVERQSLRARTTGRSLAIAILDLDHFKRFNDSLGHQAGDALLTEAARVWLERLDERGVLARYGGEEFGILLPDHTLDEAAELLETIRAATPGNQTVSIGLAVMQPGEDAFETVRRADEALYRAKAAGRDRLVVDRRVDAPTLFATA